MTSSKSILLKDTELTKWWISIVHDHRFDRVKTFARADIMEHRLTANQIIGCEFALSTLESLIDPDAVQFDINDAEVGLNHNLVHQRELAKDPDSKED